MLWSETMNYAYHSFEEIYQHHVDASSYFELVTDIITNTIYKLLISEDIVNIDESHIKYNCRHTIRDIWHLGFLDTQISGKYYKLTDRGFQFLLWMVDNHFRTVVESLDRASLEDINNYINYLIPEKDLALALSISENPKKLLSAYNLT